MKTFRKNRSLRWAAVVAWMGLIFYLSAQPRLPLVMPPGWPQIQDIVGHFTVYAVLAVLLWWALRGAGFAVRCSGRSLRRSYTASPMSFIKASCRTGIPTCLTWRPILRARSQRC